MRYEFVSMGDAGTQTGDYIIRLRCKPSWLQRCLGLHQQPVAFYGRDMQWHTIGGDPVGHRFEAILRNMWNSHRPPDSGCRSGPDGATPTIYPQESSSIDIVQVASEGSFPASDPPAWTLGRGM